MPHSVISNPPPDTTLSGVQTAFYPIGLNLNGKIVLIVGAGSVGLRKLERLCGFSCQLYVLDPTFSQDFHKWSEQTQRNIAQVIPIETAYSKPILQALKPDLVFACTNHPTLNRQICEDAQQAGILCNSATDGVTQSDFIVPSLMDYAPLQIAIFSGGTSPMFVKQLRLKLETFLGPWIMPYLAILGRIRQKIQHQIPEAEARHQLYERASEHSLLLKTVTAKNLSQRAIEDFSQQILEDLLKTDQSDACLTKHP